MDFLTGLFAAAPGQTRPGPIDDYWYSDFHPLDGSVRPTAHTALSLSTVYRGVSVLANTLGMLPLPVLETLPDEGGHIKARSHRLWRTLHDRPNRWQTAFQWRQMGMGHCILRGNFYNRILSGPRGFGTELVPLHPTRVEVVDQLASGQLVYRYDPPGGGPQETLLGGDEMLHIRAFSDDGCTGVPLLSLMRRLMESATNMERFGARFFSAAPTMRGVLTRPPGTGRLAPDAREAVETSFQKATSGPAGWHRVPLLEGGMEWQSIGVSNEDSQFLESKEATVPDFARFIGVPTVLLMHADKTSLYANAEQFFRAFFTVDAAHWFVNWESTLNQTLFLESEQDRFGCEFNREGVLRGDAQARADYLRVVVGDLRLLTRNEARVIEGHNRMDGLDDFVTAPGSAPPASAGPPDPDPEPSDPSAGARDQVLDAAIERIVTKEAAVLTRAAAKPPAQATAAVEAFYARFPAEVARSLALPLDAAERYCHAQQGIGCVAVLDGLDPSWRDDSIGGLRALTGDHHGSPH